MAKLRIYQGHVQNLAEGVSKLRIYQSHIQLLWKDEAYWGCEFTAVSGIETDLTVLSPAGRTLIIFAAFCPQIEVKESLEWFTDIIKPTDGVGSEQRISIRPIPRQSFTLSIPLTVAKEQSRFEAIMFGWQKLTWGLPIWTEKVSHAATITAGAMSITVDTTNADFRDDSYAVIWKSLTEYEMVMIDTVTDALLTLKTAVEDTFTGDKFIMPCRICQITEAVKRNNEEVDFSIAQITFAVKDNVLLTGYVADQSYLGLPIITTGSVIGIQNKEYTSDSDSVLQDYDTGDFDYFSDSEFNLIGQNWTFYNDTRAKCWDFRLFLHSLKGRQGSCWIPTYRNDLVQVGTIGASDTDFSIENIQLANNMTFNSLRTHLAFIFPDGTIIPKAITAIIESDSEEELISINTALGLEVEVGDCIISFLDLSRQASDVVNIDWLEHNRNSINQVFTAIVE